MLDSLGVSLPLCLGLRRDWHFNFPRSFFGYVGIFGDYAPQLGVLRSSLSLGQREGWRRGELNPCPHRCPRKHLHVYLASNSEEPSHAPAHYWLPSVHEIDLQTGAVAPPV